MRYEVWSSLMGRALAAAVAMAVWGFAPSDGWPFAASAQAATVRVARDDKLQTIEGFGFFGARDAWWSPPADLVDPEWARLVIDDLGLSMWRNEYYPPADTTASPPCCCSRPSGCSATPGCRSLPH
jgi:hypothetical protein